MLGFGVLGPLEITGPDGVAEPLAGNRERALVACSSQTRGVLSASSTWPTQCSPTGRQ